MLYVYFIQQGDDGPIKIGVASSSEQRLAALQSSNPAPLRLLGEMSVGDDWFVAREVELRWHERFRSDRLSGEWFASSPELLEEIRSHSEQRQEPIDVIYGVAVEETEEQRFDRIRRLVSPRLQDELERRRAEGVA